MARLGDNPIDFCSFSVSSSNTKSVNLVKLLQGTNLGKEN